MNKTKIEWCDYTWNPISGCKHGCHYCYARRIAGRFQGTAFPNAFLPAFYPERLGEPGKVKKPSKIFVGSMGDLFGDWEWARASGPDVKSQTVINMVLGAVNKFPQHTFIFLTKNPKRYQGIEFPDNCWIGTSAEDQATLESRIWDLMKADAAVRFLSLEPLKGKIQLGHLCTSRPWAGGEEMGGRDHTPVLSLLDWIIVGGQTGPGAQPPKPEWVQSLLKETKPNKLISRCQIFLKDNLNWPEKIQEFPEERP